MKIRKFLSKTKKCNSAFFRRQVVELYRLEIASERQILGELKISRNLLRRWNRLYQRYRHRRYYPPLKADFVMKNREDEIAQLKKQLADTEKLLQREKLKTEALETMITIAEKQLNIPIRKKPGPKQ